MKMKEWFYDKMMKQILNYGDMWEYIETERTTDEFHTVIVDNDGYVNLLCKCEIIGETDKAVKIRFADVWTNWCPKSVIA